MSKQFCGLKSREVLQRKIDLTIEQAKSSNKIRKKFSFDINVKDFETKEITCNKCPNHCEIITVRQDKKLIDSWGNRCPNGEIKIKEVGTK